MNEDPLREVNILFLEESKKQHKTLGTFLKNQIGINLTNGSVGASTRKAVTHYIKTI